MELESKVSGDIGSRFGDPARKMNLIVEEARRDQTHARSKLMMLRLKVPVDWQGVKEVPVDHFPFQLGRAQNNDCCLLMAFVSRQHCQFVSQADGIWVRDLESYNGTFLNGHRVTQPCLVKNGDVMSLGALQFEVLMTNVSEECPMTPRLTKRSSSSDATLQVFPTLLGPIRGPL